MQILKGGNISLAPLPKIDEMYSRLQGARVFTTLDLRSGYYHIGLSKTQKLKLLLSSHLVNTSSKQYLLV